MSDSFQTEEGETPACGAASISKLSHTYQPSNKTYLCIDLKSFYASVECVDRGLDPFVTNLVVADPERSANTICLAITPALKARGVRNRCRLRDVPEGIDYVCAMPRMKRYMEVSGHVVDVYRQFVSSDDMHVYSIDESFIDATPYLKLYSVYGRTFAKMLMQAVFDQTGITATAGIGPNLLMAKVALDVCAKHAPDGIGQLDDESWRREIWFHRPITDIWGIGPGIARRLAKHGVFDLAGVCSLSKKSIQKEFGKNGLFLLDHAWGQEPCTISQAKNYRRRDYSITNGQVLMRDYSYDEVQTLIREMALSSCLELTEKGLVAANVGIWVGYSSSGVSHHAWDHGRAPAFGAGGSMRFPRATDSVAQTIDVLLDLYLKHVDPRMAIRRVNIALGGLIDKGDVQLSLFDDPQEEGKEEAVAQAMVAVRSRFGKNAVFSGTSLLPEANGRERNMQVGGHRA